MSESEKYAYRQLIRWALIYIRGSCEGLSAVSWNPLVWRRRYLRSREAGAIAEWLHNLADFTSRDFERFDTSRFWKEYEKLCRDFPQVATYHFRQTFEEMQVRFLESKGRDMALYLGSIVINVTDVERSARFWAAALNYVVRDAEADFVVLTDPKRRWANVSLQFWDEPKAGRNRLHFDLYCDNQSAEVERLEALGAVRLAWDYAPGADYVVMADPEGNEFCVIASPFGQD